jgi:hypothetical protein
MESNFSFNNKIELNDINDIKIILFFEKVKEKYKLNDFNIVHNQLFNVISISSQKFKDFYIEYKLSYYSIYTKYDHRNYYFENNEDLFYIADMIINTDCIKLYWGLNHFYIDIIKYKTKGYNDFIILESDDYTYFINNDYCIKFKQKMIKHCNVLYDKEILKYSSFIKMMKTLYK